MPDKVRCAICGADMTVINNRHLAKHSLTADEYKVQFPDCAMMTDAVAKKLSDRSIRSNTSRKGKPRSEQERVNMRAGHARLPTRTGVPTGPMAESQKQLLSALAKERYASGFVHPNTGKHHSAVTKRKIAESLTGRIVGPDAARKAIQTKRDRGIDLGAPMRGKHLSASAKRLISAAVSARYDAARAEKRQAMLVRIDQANLILLNRIDDDVFHLQCKGCKHIFSRNVPCFQPSKFKTAVCNQCHPPKTISDAENDVASYIAGFAAQPIVRSDRSQIAPLELDILLPAIGLAIEYCGLYYHSAAAGRHKMYHRFKLDKCREQNLRLLTIFEDEWLLKRPIVESMIRNACGLTPTKLHARACTIRELTVEECSAFLNTNHIQGRGRSQIKYGLLKGDEIVSAMTFATAELSHRTTGWEINRFATKLGHTVRGGASRLFARFLADHDPQKITSYADLRWGSGNVYARLGFEHVGDTVPGYWYVQGLQRYHRFSLRKSPAEPVDQTEFELRSAQGWTWIFDCGHAKWVYTR